MADNPKRLFLLDGMALVYRAYYALIRNPRMTSGGFNASAIFGYTNTLINILATQSPSHIAVAFDTPEPTARHKEFPAYKAQREAMPEDIADSLPPIRAITEAFNIAVITRPGYEADDVIGTLARIAESDGFDTYMVTPDKDFSQLVDNRTWLYKPGRAGDDVEILDVKGILDKWAVDTVSQIPDILGLWGDSSDNIPGIPGIGEKTAKLLIQRFGSIEELIANVDSLKGKQKENVEQYGAQALLSKRLATIDCKVPDMPSLTDLAIETPNNEQLRQLFAEFEFKTLAKRFLGDTSEVTTATPTEKNQGGTPDLFDFATDTVKGEGAEDAAVPQRSSLSDIAHSYQLIQTPEERAKLVSRLAKADAVCFDVETTSLDTKRAELIGIGFSMAPHSGYFVLLPDERESVLRILEEFRAFFEDDGIRKIGHNLKYDISVLSWHGIAVRGMLDDTMLAHYILEPEARHGMDILAQIYLEYESIPITRLIGEKGAGQGTLRDVAVADLVDYAVEDVDVTIQLAAILCPKIEEIGCEKIYRDIELKLLPVLVAMEAEGVGIDVPALSEYGRALQEEIIQLESAIHTEAGVEFNIDSPKQLGEILFDHLQLDAKAKRTSKTKQYSTSEQVLSRLAPKHPIVGNVLDYRSLRKLKTTYIDTLPQEIFPETGRVHTTYNQGVTATGRLNSQSPNLQNIPIKTARGKEIRRAFVPRDDRYRIMAADYSQIELRIVAEMSGDEFMLDAFQNETDVHRATAAKIYGVKPENVTGDMRRKSKMVNFGIIYGISAFGLAQRLNIPRKEAQFIIEQYFAEYPKIKAFMDQTIEFARENGYVETLMGRRRYVRDINSRNATLRNSAERNAINAPVQGTAADMIKIAMIKIHHAIIYQEFQSKMIMQVHDELVFELYRKEKEKIVPVIATAMESALPMAVPIVVEIGIGDNWLEAH